MIEWGYRRAASARRVGEVLVATDDRRVHDAVTSFGGRSVMTSPDCRSGTERVAEAAEIWLEENLPGNESPPVIVNLQGDEPLIQPEAIDQLIGVFDSDSGTLMATLMRRMGPEEDPDNPNIVKVVTGLRGNALYFSRHPIPYHRDQDTPAPPCFQHYGLYAFQLSLLRRLVQLPPSPLEESEKLEQLRALENGIPIRVLETEYAAFGVDTPEDLEIVRRRVKEQELRP
jgi:3-deoxy-manno-octulosonate cytidylyltransferase (CMP-KDO synthetase)